MIRTLAAALATTTCIVALATPAAAQTREFNIPSGSLSSALDAFARQSGRQVIYRGDEVRSVRSPGVRGARTAEDALDAILAGTGFQARKDSSGAFAVAKLGNAPAPAETAASSGDGAGGAVNDQAEIVVTAQKRPERLVDAPQAVTVISAANLRQLNATQFRDFADAVPGLSFATSGAGYNRIALRGITTGSDLGPTVGIYVDDVPYGSSSSQAGAGLLALDVGLFDIDQIEVLKGPQGTLYGASTMGGLLKYVTKRPNPNQTSADIQAGVSATQHGGLNYNGAAAVNIPVVKDKLAIRASGYYSHDGGYIDNITLHQSDVNRSNIYGGRVDVLAIPTDNLSIRLTGFAQDIMRDGTSMVDYNLDGTRAGPDLTQSRLIEEPFDSKFRLISGTIDYNFAFAKLTSVSSYQTSHSIVGSDSSFLVPTLAAFFGRDYSAVGARNGVDTDKSTQEIRLTSHKGPIEWILGGFFTDEKSKQVENTVLIDPAGNLAPNDVLSGVLPSRYKEYAAFGDVTYHFNSRFDVSAGLRYASNTQRFSRTETGILASSLPETRSKDHKVTYLANARYHFTNDVTGYLRFATGYRPGGPNFGNIDPTTGGFVGSTTFGPDHLSSYEAGIKGQTRNRVLSFDLAAYYINWDNFQILGIRNFAATILNAPGGAAVRGGELTLNVHPIEDFILTGAFAYQDAHLAKADADLGARAGERLPLSPRFSATINADYRRTELPLQPRIGATLRSVSNRTVSFDDSVGNPQYRLPSYTTLDLRAGLTVDKIDLQLFVRNLFDVRPQVTAVTFQTFAGLPAQVTVLPPRTIGVSAGASF